MLDGDENLTWNVYDLFLRERERERGRERTYKFHQGEIRNEDWGLKCEQKIE